MKGRFFCMLAMTAAALSGCGGGGDVTKKMNSTEEEMIVGPMDRSFMRQAAYKAYQDRYDTVDTQQPVVEMIGELHHGIDVVVFLGTWCGDSRREVPRFLKIADEAGIPATQITLYGVDRKKSSGDGKAEQYALDRVPTFVFLKDGREVGRIVESPKSTLEEDMLVILIDARK